MDEINFTRERGELGGVDIQSKIRTVKIDFLDSSDDDICTNLFFTKRLLKLVIDGKLDAYDLHKEVILGQNEIKERLIKRDTFTYSENEELHIIDKRPVSSRDIKSFYIKQYWYYRKTQKKIQSVVYEIIPIVLYSKLIYKDNDESEMEMIKGETFRIKLNQSGFLETPPNINHEEVKWVKQTVDVIGLGHFSNVLKGVSDGFFKELLWTEPLKSGQEVERMPYSPCYEGNGCTCEIAPELLTQERKEWLFTHHIFKDTVEMRNEDFVYLDIVHFPPCKFEDVLGIETKQVWYLNEKEGTVFSQLKSIVPVIKERESWYTFRQRRGRNQTIRKVKLERLYKIRY